MRPDAISTDNSPATDNPAYHFRPAQPADTEAIRMLVRSSSVHSRSRHTATYSQGHPPKRPFLSRVLSPLYSAGIDHADFIVAETDSGNLIACARIKKHKGGIREIATISIARAWRGKGIPGEGAKYILENYPRPLWGTCLSSYARYYRKFGAIEVTDARKLPFYFRQRRWYFNLMLCVMGSRKRLSVIIIP